VFYIKRSEVLLIMYRKSDKEMFILNGCMSYKDIYTHIFVKFKVDLKTREYKVVLDCSVSVSQTVVNYFTNCYLRECLQVRWT